MPAAARITDAHTCPDHGGGPVEAGCTSVIIGHQPAARVGDTLLCPPGTDVITEGDTSVLIGFQPAARIGDATSHGGALSAGCPTVTIGGGPSSLKTDKPFCEDCAAKRKQAEAQNARKRARGA